MSRKPKAVQLEALRRARGKPGFGFLMEQGLGKTGTAFLECAEIHAEGGADRMVVFSPYKFRQGWLRERHEWGFDCDAYVFGDQKYIRPSNKLQVLVVGYEAVRSENTQAAIEGFIGDKRCYIVADESVQLATYNSAQTKACIKLSKGRDWRRILSGRWMRNAPDDTWAQLRFINAIEGDFFPFRHTYVELGGFKGKVSIGPKNEEKFAKLIAPYVFEALKKDWGLDIPKTYTTYDYKLTPTQQSHFDSMHNDFMVFANDEVVSVDVAIAKWEKMAQIQCGYIIREDGTILELVEPAKNPRLNLLKDVRQDVAGKMCIPYTHRYVGTLLHAAYPDAARIAGGVKDVEEEKLRFNTQSNCREILLQTRSAKYGHTLLGDQSLDTNACSTMALFENTYSMDDRAQIEDRIHRTGLEAPFAGYIDFAGTIIDRNMVGALQRRNLNYETVMSILRGRNT